MTRPNAVMMSSQINRAEQGTFEEPVRACSGSIPCISDTYTLYCNVHLLLKP